MKYDSDQGSKWLHFKPLIGDTIINVITLSLKKDHFNLLLPKHVTKGNRIEPTRYWDWFEMKMVESSGRIEKEEADQIVDIENGVSKRDGGIKKMPCKSKGKKGYKGKIGMSVGNDKDNIQKQKLTKVEKKNNIVTNLSKKILTEAQERLLIKGFTFIPTRRNIDMTKLLTDLAEWERRMRLKEFFFHEQEQEGEKPKEKEEPEWMKRKGYFTPKQGRSKWLDTYIEAVKGDIVASLKKNCIMNITKEEEAAMKELLADDEIIIRMADKGSGIVVVNKEDYIEELEGEVEGNTSYKVTDKNKLKQVEKDIKKLAGKMYKDGHIDKDLRSYLTPKYQKAGQLKGNPKIHKKGNPYRAIVNGKGTQTERMAGIAEKELEEYVVGSPSYIQDTTDFLQQLQSLKQPLPEDTILFCFDIVKLYPSIPRKEGREACREALEIREDKTIPTEDVLKMIDTVLQNNIFTFNDKYYEQEKGVAIGSKLGKNYSCAYMRKFDEHLLHYEEKPDFYRRFIDDGFGIWTKGEKALKQFLEHANGIHPDIKIVMRWDRHKIEFLDTWVKLQDGEIITDLYTKETDKHLYVQSKSCHPSSTKKAIPYSLGIRIKRICSREEDYTRHRGELKKQLRRRGYSSKFIEGQLRRVDDLNRNDLLKYKAKEKKNNDRVPLVLTYSRQLPDVHKIIYKHLPILHKSEALGKIFDKPPLVSFRRDRNLGDVLIHGKLNKTMKSGTVGRCEDEKCVVCTRLANAVESTDGKNKYKTKLYQGCETINIVYGIKCSRCEKVKYVGETERRLKDRIKEHIADIRHNRDTAVGHHFNETGHNLKDLSIVILDRVVDKSRVYRRIKEKEWMDNLKTEIPNGLNKKANLGVLWGEY